MEPSLLKSRLDVATRSLSANMINLAEVSGVALSPDEIKRLEDRPDKQRAQHHIRDALVLRQRELQADVLTRCLAALGGAITPAPEIVSVLIPSQPHVSAEPVDVVAKALADIGTCDGRTGWILEICGKLTPSQLLDLAERISPEAKAATGTARDKAELLRALIPMLISETEISDFLRAWTVHDLTNAFGNPPVVRPESPEADQAKPPEVPTPAAPEDTGKIGVDDLAADIHQPEQADDLEIERAIAEARELGKSTTERRSLFTRRK